MTENTPEEKPFERKYWYDADYMRYVTENEDGTKSYLDHDEYLNSASFTDNMKYLNQEMPVEFEPVFEDGKINPEFARVMGLIPELTPEEREANEKQAALVQEGVSRIKKMINSATYGKDTVSPANPMPFPSDTPEFSAAVRERREALAEELKQRMASQLGVSVDEIGIVEITRPFELSSTNVEAGDVVVYQRPDDGVINLSDLTTFHYSAEDASMSEETARALMSLPAKPTVLGSDGHPYRVIPFDEKRFHEELWEFDIDRNLFYHVDQATDTLTYMGMREDEAPRYPNLGVTGVTREFYPDPLQDMILKFHRAFNAPAAHDPRAIGPVRGKLRHDMLKEELTEFDDAVRDDDIVEQYDALLDILVLAFGGLVEMGLDAKPGFEEVHRANMSKLLEDGTPKVSRGMEEDGFPEGKILKGPNYIKPDLFSVLVFQGWVPRFKVFMAYYPEPEGDDEVAVAKAIAREEYVNPIVRQIRRNACRDDVPAEDKEDWGVTGWKTYP